VTLTLTLARNGGGWRMLAPANLHPEQVLALLVEATSSLAQDHWEGTQWEERRRR